jgi:hypothetical protein
MSPFVIPEIEIAASVAWSLSDGAFESLPKQLWRALGTNKKI